MYSCIDCEYLDKSRKNYLNKGNQNYFQYGCNKRGADKFICGWCSSDSNLKQSSLGCSDWIPKKQDDKFLKGLAKCYEVLVCGERHGKHFTYQYSEEKFLKEFYNNHFTNPDYDGDIVENFYYKGNQINNFKTFPGTYETDSETMYDVVAYILKTQCKEAWNSRHKTEPKQQFYESTEQLPGQMSIMDFI